tara:strand:- start:2897 stop:4795 length:1899 start_codon:yes stop_codon:yes gene_type:complete
MGADSVLVNAAHKLGMSRVPGDTAEIFNKQYEGLIAYHKASADATVEGVKAGVVGGSVAGGLVADGVNAIIAGVASKKASKMGPATKENPKGTGELTQEQVTARKAEIKAAQAGKKLKNKSRHEKLTDAVYGKDSETEDGEETKAEARAGDLQLYKDKIDYKRKSKHESKSDEHKTVDADSSTGVGDFKTVDQLEMERYGYVNPEPEENTSIIPSGGLSAFKKMSPVKNVDEKPAGINTSNLRKSSGPKKSTILSEGESSSQSPSASEMNKTIEKMVTDLAIDGIKKAGKHYDDGGGMNNAHFEAADLGFRTIKNQIYSLINKKNMTLEDKKQNNFLQKETERLKKNVVNIKGLVIQTAQAYNEGHVNTDLSFLGRPNEQMLLKQVMDPKANLGQLGISAMWKDGELYYEYGPSQMAMEYAASKGIEVDPEQIMSDERKTIAASTLFGMAVMKDTKSENDINGVIKKAGEDAIEKIGNTGKLLNTDFSRVKGSIENNFRDIFENSKVNFQDLATRDLTIGGSKRNYKKDLELNPEINALTYTNLGLTASFDENSDGVISGDELAPRDREIIIETLTNPKTSDQKEAAVNELTKYCTWLAAQEFHYMRKASGEDKGGKKSILAQDLIAKYNKA